MKPAITLSLMFCFAVSIAIGQSRIEQLMSIGKEGVYLDSSSWVINDERDTVSYETFEGKWLVIDYWTAGCRPCLKEFPYMKKYAEEHGFSNLEIISLNIDQQPSRWEKYSAKYNIGLPDYYSGADLDNPFLAINFKYLEEEGQLMTSTPQYVLIDPSGKIVDKDLPKPSSKKFDQVLKGYLEE